MKAESSIPWKVQSWNFNVTLCSVDAVGKMSIDKTVNCLCTTLLHWASLQFSEYQNLLLCVFPTAAAFVLDLTSSAFLSPSTALTNCDSKWTDNDLSRWIFMKFSRTLSTKNELLHSESTINRYRVCGMMTMTMTTRARNTSAWRDWQLLTISSYRCKILLAMTRMRVVRCMRLSDDDENIDRANFGAARMKNCHNIEKDY